MSTTEARLGPEALTATDRDGSVEKPFDVVVVGAGISGLYQLVRLRELGLSVRLIEAGSGVGGTWYWNRYPGARLDSESYSYGYFFSHELLNEWEWSEEFVGQPELEEYFNLVADKFDLRRSIQFNTRVASMKFDSASAQWILTAEDGRQTRTRIVVSATGMLSAPIFPPVPGLENYAGEAYHTARWPKEPVSFKGKRVAVVGTGASGVQVISDIKSEAGHLTVFQRTPNWNTPINNSPILPAQAAQIRHDSQLIRERCSTSATGFVHTPIDVDAMSVSAGERENMYNQLWDAPGLSLYAGNYRDTFTNQESNDAVTSYLARRIRHRINDPRVADKLIPTYGFGMKRPPLENGYYEAFNQENVELVNLHDDPIEQFTDTGLITTGGARDFDIIVLATGFDAVTGALLRMGVEGEDDLTLNSVWESGPRTFLGMFVSGFPNLFIVGGPQSVNGNQPRSTEFQVNWVTDCIRHMTENGIQRIEADESSVEAWVDHINRGVSGQLRAKFDSWFFGSNVPGKVRAYQLYAGTMNEYKTLCSEIAKDRYRGIALDGLLNSRVEGVFSAQEAASPTLA